jgi:hypothetical protein
MAKIYWRTSKRGTRTFNDCPANLQDDIKALAKQDVVEGVITEAQYKTYIGEDYVAE